MSFVEIDGHKVDERLVDRFYNAHDGSRVSDEDWDESKRRELAAVDDVAETEEEALARMARLRARVLPPSPAAVSAPVERLAEDGEL